MTDAAHLCFIERGVRVRAQLRELRVAEAVLLRDAQGRGIQLVRLADELGDLVDEDDLVEEPRVDPGRVEELLDRRARGGGPAAPR